jgi:putative DNA primase/helicase
MTLLPHSMDYFFTTTLRYSFDKDAECPRFDRFMDEVTVNNEDMKNTLLEFLGYSFSGMEYRWHKVLILPGDGSNGKSTFLNVIKALAGKTYSALLVNQFEDEKMRCNLIGKLFNVAEETPRKGLMDSSHFKMLTSGGEYTARAVYSKPLEIDNNRTKFMMACNELPAINDFSHGMIRRLLICPFEAVFTEGVNADPELDSKLRAELPGILNRVIEGYQRLIKQNRFTLSQTSIDAVSEYRDTADTVSMWCAEYLERSTREDLFVSATDMYLSYKNFCSKLGIFTVSLQKFGRDIAQIGRAHV